MRLRWPVAAAGVVAACCALRPRDPLPPVPEASPPAAGAAWHPTPTDAEWAAVTAIEEAPPEGRTAVVWVVRRRMRACGCSAREVVTEPWQFQPWRQPWKSRRMLRRLARPDAELLAETARAARVLSGRVPDPVSGADHFHAWWCDPPSWAAEMVRTAELGGNVFYRRSR